MVELEAGETKSWSDWQALGEDHGAGNSHQLLDWAHEAIRDLRGETLGCHSRFLTFAWPWRYDFWLHPSGQGGAVKLLKRDRVDAALDRVRFELDKFPRMDYQPLPWLGVPNAGRVLGVQTRWEAIEPFLTDLEITTAVDVGSNVGFYSISLTMKGIVTLAVEANAKFFRSLVFAANKLDLDNLGCLYWHVTPVTAKMLPSADCFLFLSVWHHIVRHQGQRAAAEVLGGLWARTGKVLFFETGELEMGPHFRLPDMKPSPAQFLHEYLKASCPSGSVQHLGQHEAFAPGHRGRCKRNLFAVVR